MPRPLDEAAHARRRDEFLDATQRLLQAKGFHAMTVGDVLAETGASKGAFYHYFESKNDLLDALLRRMFAQLIATATPIVEEPGVPALEKLARLFDNQTRWKGARRSLIVAAARGWYGDDNAQAVTRMRAMGAVEFGRLITSIVREGNTEGVFDVADPEVAGRLVFAVLQDFHDSLIPWFIGDDDPTPAQIDGVCRRLEGYNTAMQRILGAPPDSVRLTDERTARGWFE